MAVNNSLAKKEQKAEVGVVYEVNGMQINLTPQLVKNYLVSGDKERVTYEELAMFINLCKFNQLNPWLKEAYCIKYGNEPATMVVAKEAFQKRAEEHPAFDGQESGIIVINADGEVKYRVGKFKLPDEEIVGGWAEVWRKDRSHSSRTEVSFDEYAGRKKDGTLNSQWAKKPATMIEKVATVQALRTAFPKNLGSMYSAEEQGIDDSMLNEVPIEPPKTIEEQPQAAIPVSNNTEPTQEATAPQDAQMALFGK